MKPLRSAKLMAMSMQDGDVFEQPFRMSYDGPISPASRRGNDRVRTSACCPRDETREREVLCVCLGNRLKNACCLRDDTRERQVFRVSLGNRLAAGVCWYVRILVYRYLFLAPHRAPPRLTTTKNQ